MNTGNTPPQQNRTPASIDSQPPASFRILLVSLLSAAIGLAAGVAFALYKLIGLFTNLFFFHRWSADFACVPYLAITPTIKPPTLDAFPSSTAPITARSSATSAAAASWPPASANSTTNTSATPAGSQGSHE